MSPRTMSIVVPPANLSLYKPRGRQRAEPLWDARLSGVRAEEQVHDRSGAPDLALGTRSRPRDRAGAARSKSGQDARAPPDCGASLRHDKVVDGIDALPDENAQARRHRNGAACPGLQHETRDEDSGCWRIDGGNPRMTRALSAPIARVLRLKA